MMNWNEFSRNPETLKSVFSQVPDLKGVYLQTFSLDSYGPEARANIILPFSADKFPEKWKSQGLELVRVVVSFVSVEMIKIDGWNVRNIVDIEISQVESKFKASILGSGTFIGFEFLGMHILKISGTTAKEIPTGKGRQNPEKGIGL